MFELGDLIFMGLPWELKHHVEHLSPTKRVTVRNIFLHQECNETPYQECIYLNKISPTSSTRSDTYLWQRWQVLGWLKKENFFFRQAKQTCKISENSWCTSHRNLHDTTATIRDPSHLPPNQLLVKLPILELNVYKVSTGCRRADTHDLFEGQLANGYLILCITAALWNKFLDKWRVNWKRDIHNHSWWE